MKVSGSELQKALFHGHVHVSDPRLWHMGTTGAALDSDKQMIIKFLLHHLKIPALCNNTHIPFLSSLTIVVFVVVLLWVW